MSEQLQHDVLPHATHDELARQNFVQSLKVYLASKVSPGNKVVYEKRANSGRIPTGWRKGHCSGWHCDGGDRRKLRGMAELMKLSAPLFKALQ